MTSLYFKKARSIANDIVVALDHAGHVLTDYVDTDLSCIPYSLRSTAESFATRLDEVKSKETMDSLMCEYQMFEPLLRASALGLRAEIDRVAPEENASVAAIAIVSMCSAAGMVEAVYANLMSEFSNTWGAAREAA
ncbi:hypothetical protein [Xenophilus azovorans]|uniref:hypothetical protein n=1 Tax=Xenophilus azovorans TaxID=151755 RepID=UPI00056E891E|nr:hypothetical protein [Xenophilus azovorans]